MRKRQTPRRVHRVSVNFKREVNWCVARVSVRGVYKRQQMLRSAVAAVVVREEGAGWREAATTGGTGLSRVTARHPIRAGGKKS